MTIQWMILVVLGATLASCSNRSTLENVSHSESDRQEISSMTQTYNLTTSNYKYEAKEIKTLNPTWRRGISDTTDSDTLTANFNTEDYSNIVENEFKQVMNAPLSTFSIDVDKAAYGICRSYLMRGQMPPKGAIRLEEMINYFDYDYPQPKNEHPFSITTETATCPWNGNHKLVHLAIQGKELDTKSLPASNLVFLIDVSGSMSDENKLPLVKSALSLLVNQLREKDKVTIVVYAGAAGLVLPPTSGNDKDTILQAIKKLESGGSTAGGKGIELAYKVASENFQKDGNNRVILATDGDFNVGASSDSDLVELIEEKRKEGIFLTVLGFGMGNYKDNKMEQLADKGNGNYSYIDNLMEAKKVFIDDLTGTLFTIAKDVKIQIEFNPAHVKEYRLIGYENRKLENEDFNNDQKDAGELGAGHTVTVLYEIIPTSATVPTTTDNLTYQDRTVKADALKDPNWMTIKLRYKTPDSETSQLIELTAKDSNKSWETASANLKFSAAVASFGMLLRNSAFKGNTSYAQVVNWAKGAKGADQYGYRTEFIQLVELAAALQSKD